MIFSVKLLCGTIIDININLDNSDINLYYIKTKVYESLPKCISSNVTPQHIQLFSFYRDFIDDFIDETNIEDNESLENLYKDIFTGSIIGCYIHPFIIEIEADDKEYYLNLDYLDNNDQGPYEKIIFKIITNVVLLEFSIYDHIKILDTIDYFVTSRTGVNLNIITIDPIYPINLELKYYKSIEELFVSKMSNISNISNISYEDVCFKAKKEYENFKHALMKKNYV